MSEINYEKIGLLIKEYRKKLKLTQKEFGEKIGKTESTIRKYEKGLVQIPNDVLEKIANFLDVPLFRLISTEYNEKLNQALKESYKKIYTEIIKNPNEKPLYIEKIMLKNEIDEKIWLSVREFIGHKFLYYKLEIDKYEIEIISEKVIDYLNTLTNEMLLKKQQEKLEKLFSSSIDKEEIEKRIDNTIDKIIGKEK